MKAVPRRGDAGTRRHGDDSPRISASPRLRVWPGGWLAIFLVMGCGERPTEAPTLNPVPAQHDPEALNFMDGVVVTDRSGELQLSNSALHAIDGDRGSIWITPPGDIRQDLTLSLPARTRIESVGLSNGVLVLSSRAANRVSIEWSADGTRFQPLHIITVDKIADKQLFRTPPVEAIALRATILGTLGHSTLAELPELLIHGVAIEPTSRSQLTGRWKLNQLSARFSDDGTRVRGVVEMDPPMHVDGAWDGPVVRFAWVRNKQFGVGVLGLDRSGRKLNGLWWFREAIPQFFGTSWFGDRIDSSATNSPSSIVAEVSLRERQTFPLYPLKFDAKNNLTPDSAAGIELLREILDANPQKRFRLVANEVRGHTPEENLRRTEQQLASVRQMMRSRGVDLGRITFAPAGNRYSREPSQLPYYTLLHSRVDLEVIQE